MADFLTLNLDLTQKRLFKGVNDPGAFVLPKLYEGDKVSLSLTLYDLTDTLKAPFYTLRASVSGWSVVLYLGNAGTVLTTVALAYDSGSTFKGTLDLTGTAISDLTADPHKAVLEAKITDDAVTPNIYRAQAAALIAKSVSP